MFKQVNIIVNGFKEKVPENSTISFLISHFDEKDVHLIVEHNGKFVFPQKYQIVKVSEGDKIEFINPNLGG